MCERVSTAVFPLTLSLQLPTVEFLELLLVFCSVSPLFSEVAPSSTCSGFLLCLLVQNSVVSE